MVKSDSNNNENILVKVDQNNLIYVDPNSVIDRDGNINPRSVNPENYVIYVNLEADIVPRSILTVTDNKNTLVSIAKGTLNFLSNQDGKDYDTSWTDAFTEREPKITNVPFGNFGTIPLPTGKYNTSDSSGQSFGIDSISVLIKGANSIPTVTINFVDVRGKTLFESAENSPYQAFFHIPWPIFYLTLKGYYGKAIRYRLHLVKFSSRFNESNGNFEVTTTFVGSTFAFLNDISTKSILNAPYMFLVENTKNTKIDEKTNNRTVEIQKSSKGYYLLRSIYQECKKKGLIDPNFPTITLREMIVKAQSLDKILEKKILSETLHPDIFVGLQDYENAISTFTTQVLEWGKKYLSVTTVERETINNVEILLYNFKNVEDGKTDKLIKGTTEGILQYIVDTNNIKLQNSKLFTDELLKAASDKKTGGGDFSKTRLLSKNVASIDKYYKCENGKCVVKIDLLIDDINEVKNVFVQERDKVETIIENEMNKIIKDPTIGFGFEPTIRNIFAVILANADVYIRLMKDVHQKAFEQSNTRKEILKQYSNETKGDGPIYPWPEVKKNADNEKARVIAYPAEKGLVSKLKTDNPILWPEIQFVENYIEVSTNKLDPNVDKENNVNTITYVFTNDDNNNNFKYISTVDTISKSIPYLDLTPSSLFYEIYERANYLTLIDNFNEKTLSKLALLEFENILEAVKDNNELITFLRDLILDRNVLLQSLVSFSPFERYPYYQDQLPTIPYITDLFNNNSFTLEQNTNVNNKITTQDYVDLNNNLINYVAETYRADIYPFNSSLYLNYLNTSSFTVDEFRFKGVLQVDLTKGFITSPNQPKSWVKPSFVNKHLFSYTLKINNTNSIVLNTPYFHKQLFFDFNKTSAYGKYAGSAYLLLNSMPFLDLEDKLTFNYLNGQIQPIRMSSLFREVGSTHFIPYHLICKWGAIYHRYKKQILEDKDILDGFLNINNLSTPIDGSLFFNNNLTGSTYTGFTVDTKTITYSSSIDVGVHPYYDAIYHQVINNYNHYDVISGNTSFSINVNQKAINLRFRKKTNNLLYWTSYVDNSKFDITTKYYTLMPCDGDNNLINITQIPNLVTGTQTQVNIEDFTRATQSYYKIIWEDSYINDSYNNRKFPSHDEYFKTYSTTQSNNSLFSVDGNYRKAIDLIGTFSPEILEEFEDTFLRFASEKLDESADQKFPNIKYTNFQSLLKEITTVNKLDSDSNLQIEDLIKNLKTRQQTKLIDITNNLLSTENVLKFTLANPKEINQHIWYGFSGMDTNNTLTYRRYDPSQLTDENKKYIKLYIGEDIDLSYQNFFLINDVELNETNILQFRPLILMYAGYLKKSQQINNAFFQNSKTTFQNYIKSNVFNSTNGTIRRRDKFLNILIPKFRNLQNAPVAVGTTKIVSGHETDELKRELYNFFKSFNDKWIGGNSIGQRLLLEEFLFLDKANKDIGSSLFLNIDRITEIGKQDYDKTNLYSIISILIQGTGIDMRPMPAYINFYGTNYSNKTRITPSKKIATNLFGTFLEVDYQESSPKIILQLVGPTSKHLEITSKKYKFIDDSFNISSVNNNPLIITRFNDVDLTKSNRVVAFEVSFGDQNQGIFKGVQLDQTSLKNTTESFIVLENLARSESGAGAYNVDVSLFDYYRQASYTCDVTCMGNAMIQPTMFFYLKNIPMFKGSYWITEVTHNIKGNNFTTTFKGTRIPYASLPDPKDSFISSYRVLFDRLRQNTIKKQNGLVAGTFVTNVSIKSTDGKTYTTNIGQEFQNEDFNKNKVERAGISEYGIPYNGFIDGTLNGTNIQLVNYAYPGQQRKEWYRAIVFEYGSTENFTIEDNNILIAFSRIKNNPTPTYSEIKDTRKELPFYSLNIDARKQIYLEKLRSVRTIFVNPETNDKIDVIPTQSGTEGKRKITGLVDSYTPGNFGIGLSNYLMKKLKFRNGSVVYFNFGDL